MSSSTVRVLTINLWALGGDWSRRRKALSSGIVSVRPDLVAFAEAVKSELQDTAAELVGPGFHLAYQTKNLMDDGICAAVASRWPLGDVHELDQRITSRTLDYRAATLIVEVEAPPSIGPILFVNHNPSWRYELEFERERQAVVAARWVEEFLAAQPMHAVLAGDLNAVPEAASIRFLSGLQSLEGLSVSYRDAWAALHPDDPGHTFSLRNPLMTVESNVRQELSRRIDYIFVRCDERGPTLAISSCSLAFDQPIDSIWASEHLGVVADLAVARA